MKLSKYPTELIEEFKKITGAKSDKEIETQLNHMSKIEIMDKWVDVAEKIDADVICKIVQLLFEVDLISKTGTTKSVTLHSAFHFLEEKVTGAMIRNRINELFGINLDAIASLETARISLFSKNQWIVRHERDLFVVHTGEDDVDAWVYPTEYFMKHTATHELPQELQETLTQLGYSFNDKLGSYYYRNPSGNPVPDAFKGQTMKTIIKVIQNSYHSL
ncbi:MAG: hypothetical protein ACO1OT_14355 [Heyndrickxia sp.]